MIGKTTRSCRIVVRTDQHSRVKQKSPCLSRGFPWRYRWDLKSLTSPKRTCRCPHRQPFRLSRRFLDQYGADELLPVCCHFDGLGSALRPKTGLLDSRVSLAAPPGLQLFAKRTVRQKLLSPSPGAQPPESIFIVAGVLLALAVILPLVGVAVDGWLLAMAAFGLPLPSVLIAIAALVAGVCRSDRRDRAVRRRGGAQPPRGHLHHHDRGPVYPLPQTTASTRPGPP